MMGVFSGLVFAIELGNKSTFTQKSLVHKTVTGHKGTVSHVLNDKVSFVVISMCCIIRL